MNLRKLYEEFNRAEEEKDDYIRMHSLEEAIDKYGSFTKTGIRLGYEKNHLLLPIVKEERIEAGFAIPDFDDVLLVAYIYVKKGDVQLKGRRCTHTVVLQNSEDEYVPYITEKGVEMIKANEKPVNLRLGVKAREKCAKNFLI